MPLNIKALANGELATSKGTLYAAPTAKQAIIKEVSYVNKNNGEVKVNLYVKTDGSNSREIWPPDMPLAGKNRAKEITNITLEAGDLLEGDASAGNVIFIINGVEESA